MDKGHYNQQVWWGQYKIHWKDDWSEPNGLFDWSQGREWECQPKIARVRNGITDWIHLISDLLNLHII